ncbi:halocarboxylic acid dehydrogenase DehI [Modicisalibacter xianhensis]|uniref:Halocarboxylic acid dehydrogenase DehI n=1 Tax=Modicisalibacter xianhensis TaxID=442341 RepID=A0A4R8F944_9GAMM|nr:halocarboxylic acid dehydrogenase DehI family protein [Halomonas xianhensis]TDX22144.1 halocarboxylic acid dehydrogenase DehI [Halomonas xianhensis]
MDRLDASRVTAGETLLSSLPDVMPEHASPRIQSLYDSIQKTLRVPFTNFFFRVLANWPDELEAVWHAMAPGIGTYEFEQVADELRKVAVPDMPIQSAEKDWSRLGALEEIQAFTDSIHYVLPKLVLITTSFDLGLVPSGKRELPHVIASGTHAVPMRNEQDAPDEVKAVFEEIRALHGHPDVASYYRGIGQWPGFLTEIWPEVKVHIESEAYQAHKDDILDFAQQAIEQRLAPQPLDVSINGTMPDQIRNVAALFRYRFTVDLLLDVGLIQCLLKGRQAAGRSRFSLLNNL